jgi:fibronectin type 3 domain-containing protein
LSIPSAPTNLAATAGNAQVSLTWAVSTGATSYNIYRGTTAGGEATTAVATVTSTAYTDTGLTNGTKYYYEVAAVNSSGVSAMSNEVSPTPVLPGPATSFSVSAPNTAVPGSAVSVTVKALDAFGNTATGYAGTVKISSTDAAATLPPSSALTNGLGTFGVTFNT